MMFVNYETVLTDWIASTLYMYVYVLCQPRAPLSCDNAISVIFRSDISSGKNTKVEKSIYSLLLPLRVHVCRLEESVLVPNPILMYYVKGRTYHQTSLPAPSPTYMYMVALEIIMMTKQVSWPDCSHNLHCNDLHVYVLVLYC